MSGFGQSIVSFSSKKSFALAELVIRTIAIDTTLSLCTWFQPRQSPCAFHGQGQFWATALLSQTH